MFVRKLMQQKARQSGKIASLTGLSGLLAEGENSMSKTKSNSDGSEAQINKKITLVGYLEIDTDRSAREVIDEIGDRDYTGYSYNTDENMKLECAGKEVRIYNEDFFELAENAHTGRINTVVEKNSKKSYENRKGKFCRKLMKEIYDERDVSGELSWGPTTIGDGYGSYRDEDYNRVVQFREYVRGMGLLEDHAQVESIDDPWEDKGMDCVAVVVDIVIDVDSREKLEEIDLTITEPLLNGLREHEMIERVGLEQCENTVTEKGTCLNI